MEDRDRNWGGEEIQRGRFVAGWGSSQVLVDYVLNLRGPDSVSDLTSEPSRVLSVSQSRFTNPAPRVGSLVP